MNKFNLGDVIKYEVWCVNHKDANYPDKIAYTTKDRELAMVYRVPFEYEKLILKVETSTRTMGVLEK